ncbi:hypothetical protein D3C84_912240 [compost metagenome]
MANLETALNSGTADHFLSAVGSHLESTFNGFTPDQEADSHLYWEPEGCHGWFNEFELLDHEFRIIDKDDDWVVLEALANIIVEAEGDFSLSMYDSIDRDQVHMGGVTVTTAKEFESEILITISGNLDGPIDELKIDDVEVVSPIKTIHFGTIEPYYDED